MPGNFGFLDVTSLPVDSTGPCKGLNGATLYECLVGAERGITGCIRTDAGVDTKPGQQNGLASAFNTRFDIFQGNMAKILDKIPLDLDYRPAPNTVQGTLGTVKKGKPTCRGNSPPSSNALPLPRDSCIPAGTCNVYPNSPRFGDGSWSWTAYRVTNHGGTYPAGTSATSTRYQMYLAEIATARLRTAPNNVPLPTRNETGAAQCHPNVSPDPDRRTVIAAAINCTGDMSGRTSVVPLEYVKLFMTEPVGTSGSDSDIYVEVVNTAGGVGSGAITGVYNDFIQLYR